MSAAICEMPRAKRNDVTAKIDADVIRKAKIVAAHRDIPLSQYLSDVLRPIVDREHRKQVEAAHRELAD